MPHLVILYTPNLDKPAAEGGVDMGGLCRALCDTMLAVRDEQDKQVFPHGGTRVFAYPAAHSAVSDGGAAGIAAGLGGGSSDAASTLLALNRLWELNLPRARLAGIGLALGQAHAHPAGKDREIIPATKRSHITHSTVTDKSGCRLVAQMPGQDVADHGGLAPEDSVLRA